MKGRWIYVGLAAASIGLAAGLPLRILTGVAWLAVLGHILPKGSRKQPMVLILLMVLASVPIDSVTAGRWRIDAVRDGYQIVQRGLVRKIVYCDDSNVGLDDLVEISGPTAIGLSSYDNFEISTFSGWALGQNIRDVVQAQGYVIIRRGFSLRRMMDDRLASLGDGWARRMLFGQGQPLDGTASYLFTASGMHVAVLSAAIGRLLRRHMYAQRAWQWQFNIMMVMTIVFGFQPAFIRVMLGLLALWLTDDRRDRWGLVAYGYGLYRPYGVCSLSYLIPMGLGLLSLFSHRAGRLAGRLYVLIIELWLFGQADAVALAFFGLGRRVSAVLFMAAMAAAIWPTRLALDGLVTTLAAGLGRMPCCFIGGRPALWLLALMMVMLLEYAAAGRPRFLGALAAALLVNQCQALLSPLYTVTMLDVGQGDCTVVTSPFSDHALLIDTGGSRYKDVAGDILIPYLRSQGLASVEVIVSHDDYDHDGALKSLQQGFSVTEVHRGKPASIVFNGLTISDPLADHHFADANDDSQVSLFDIGGFVFLYLGDISADAEAALTSSYPRLRADIVKVAHHGSAASTSPQLLSHLRPRWALISAGRRNRYGHPDRQVVALLTGDGISVLNTQTDHAVRFSVSRLGMMYRTAAGLSGFCWSAR